MLLWILEGAMRLRATSKRSKHFTKCLPLPATARSTPCFHALVSNYTLICTRCEGNRMAENIPPGSASKPATAGATDGRGIPYYEKLRRDLRDTIPVSYTH